VRTLVIGDIHGCLDEFEALLRWVDFRQGADRLVLCGDLLDRGPDPVGVVRRARELAAESVLGNHEEKHLRWRRHEGRRQREPGYQNPMRPLPPATLAQHNALDKDDWAWIEQRPLFLRLSPTWVVLHAGLKPGVALDHQAAAEMLRCRRVTREGRMIPLHDDLETSHHGVFWTELWTGPECVVYGHNVHEAVRRDERGSGVLTLGIDTGCCFGGRLTAAIFESDGSRLRFVETTDVAAARVYFPKGGVPRPESQ